MGRKSLPPTGSYPAMELPVTRTTAQWLLPPLAYLLVSLLATWPLMTHLRGWVAGVGDWGQNMWALWWVRHALLALGQSPFFTDYLFYPDGVTLLFHPLDVSDGLLALPLYGLLGGDISYNLLTLLSFVLGGWGAYLLALHLTHRRRASFLAGLLFALSPYHFSRLALGHLNLSTLQWIPFFVLFMLRFLESATEAVPQQRGIKKDGETPPKTPGLRRYFQINGDKKSAGLAIFFLTFTALNSWYYVIYCGLLAVALLFWPCATTLRRRVVRLGLVVGLTGLLLLPLLGPMLWLMSSTALIGEHNPLRHSVDLFSFWVPGPPSRWAGWFEDVWISYAAHNREPGASAYLGYVALGLSLAGLLLTRQRRAALWWLAVGLGFSLLALGPQLQVDGQVWPLTLPYHWLTSLFPPLALAGIPGRFVVMTSLALAMLAAYGAAALIRRRPNVGAWLLPLLGLLIFVEFLAAPLRLSSTALPPFYRQVAAEPGPYALLDIKWDANYLLHAQTVHGKPLVGGWLARLPAEQAAFLDEPELSGAFLRLLLGRDWQDIDPATYPQAVRAALTERQVRYIITHGGSAGPLIEQIVGWPVVYQAEGLTVYGAAEE